MSIINKLVVVFAICLFMTMLFIVAPLTFMTIEPLYTIKNCDEQPHNVTIKVTGYNEEYFEETFYELNPGQVASVKKTKMLLLKWSNPFKDGYLHYASGDYHYYITSKNVSINYHSTPHLTNTVVFELINESGKFNISVREYT